MFSKSIPESTSSFAYFSALGMSDCSGRSKHSALHGVKLKQSRFSQEREVCYTFSCLTCLFPEFQEELLVEDEGHAADFLHFGFCCGVPVHKVSCDGDGQLPPKLLSTETCGGKSRTILNSLLNLWGKENHFIVYEILLSEVKQQKHDYTVELYLTQQVQQFLSQ